MSSSSTPDALGRHLLIRGDEGQEHPRRGADTLAEFLAERRFTIVHVSNEVGAGVHRPPMSGCASAMRSAASNQRIAAAADRVTYMVAACP